MITLIHGDYIDASRRELNRMKGEAADKEIVTVDGRTADETMLIQALESSSLLSFGKLVVIEGMFAKIGKHPKRIAGLATLLANIDGVDVILWEEKELSPTVLKQLGRSVINRLFTVPPKIFAFLDGLRPGNARILLPIYQSLVVGEPAELVFAMLVKRVRQLIQVKDHISLGAISPWQMNRLTTQAKSFTMEQLTAMYKKLHDIEVQLRTNTSPFTLSKHIELFITSL